jgi:hypothetical protein
LAAAASPAHKRFYGKYRLPGKIGDRPEEVSGEAGREDRDREVGAERCAGLYLPFFAVSSERYSFASSTIPFA